ncbi:glycosyltransferase family 2 protein [Bacillus infantis]|uniref:glycosyltransferase family 2 protein n=1 Tax=Bacillus infantis TaxID=324767 RepID=UPI001CD79C55|nr:glycosyltransferase family 2 protein [Bacillus infantis]MCA1041613.1 glycosyltransferase family 2 protein [Bacillus infantis]
MNEINVSNKQNCYPKYTIENLGVEVGEYLMISVILPTYNRENTIYDAVMSVLSQTYTDLELIIVDDSSTDRTEEIVKDISDERVKYFKNETNIGACASRNKGVHLSQGHYIAFQDSDDIWFENKLMEQINYLKENNADLVYCAMNRYDINGKDKEKYPKRILDSSQDVSLQFLKENMAGTVCVLCKKECIKNNLFDEEMPRLQDWEFMVRVSKKYKVLYQDKVLVDSFVQKDSISNNPEKGLKAFELLYNKNKDIIDSNKEIKAYYKKRIADFKIELGLDATDEYLESLRNLTTIKVLIKFFLYKFKLLNISIIFINKLKYKFEKIRS